MRGVHHHCQLNRAASRLAISLKTPVHRDCDSVNLCNIESFIVMFTVGSSNFRCNQWYDHSVKQAMPVLLRKHKCCVTLQPVKRTVAAIVMSPNARSPCVGHLCCAQTCVPWHATVTTVRESFTCKDYAVDHAFRCTLLCSVQVHILS